MVNLSVFVLHLMTWPDLDLVKCLCNRVEAAFIFPILCHPTKYLHSKTGIPGQSGWPSLYPYCLFQIVFGRVRIDFHLSFRTCTVPEVVSIASSILYHFELYVIIRCSQ